MSLQWGTGGHRPGSAGPGGMTRNTPALSSSRIERIAAHRNWDSPHNQGSAERTGQARSRLGAGNRPGSLPRYADQGPPLTLELKSSDLRLLGSSAGKADEQYLFHHDCSLTSDWPTWHSFFWMSGVHIYPPLATLHRAGNAGPRAQVEQACGLRPLGSLFAHHLDMRMPRIPAAEHGPTSSPAHPAMVRLCRSSVANGLL